MRRRSDRSEAHLQWVSLSARSHLRSVSVSRDPCPTYNRLHHRLFVIPLRNPQICPNNRNSRNAHARSGRILLYRPQEDIPAPPVLTNHPRLLGARHRSVELREPLSQVTPEHNGSAFPAGGAVLVSVAPTLAVDAGNPPALICGRWYRHTRTPVSDMNVTSLNDRLISPSLA